VSDYCEIAPGDPWHGPYHDREYGFPITDDPITGDAALFERLSLEIQQAGLSWILVLKKREALRESFAGFDPRIVAEFGQDDIARLLGDSRIIRNRRKLEAVIGNAARILDIAGEHGSFAAWLDNYHPLDLEDWVRLFRRTFRFMGPEIVREFLVSTGYLPGAHRRSCPVYDKIQALDPPWRRKK
jgi:DNA-3-methyladenine glycosylase I